MKNEIIKSQEQEEEIIINEDDEYLGIYHLSKEQLIDTIRDIREEYFELQEDHIKLEDKYQYKLKEIEFNRKMLTEREDLLLQLQWDPNQDTSYFQQIGASDSNQANELKMKALVDQMRVMERGIFERDEKIKQMEKVIETFTLQQISNGVPPTQIVYPQYNTIVRQQQAMSSSEPNSTTATPVKQSLFNKLSQSSVSTLNRTASTVEDTPNTFLPISKYPLPKDGASVNFDPSTLQQVNVITPATTAQPLNRSTSFWQSPSTFFSNLLGRSSSDIKDNNDKHVEDSDDDEQQENYDEIDSKPHVQIPLQSAHESIRV